MTRNELPEIARKHLLSLLDESGGLLYSSFDTLKPGPVYLMGYNPGGCEGPALKHSITNLPFQTANAYQEEAWENANGSFEPGKAPLQKAVQWVVAQLGLEVRHVCASNLIFLQSRNSEGVPVHLANQCWPVHEAMLSIVQPQLIVSIGNGPRSAYQFLKDRLGCEGESVHDAGHGHFSLKLLTTRYQGRPLRVAGLPHLSRYQPQTKPQAAQWLTQLRRDALEQIVKVERN